VEDILCDADSNFRNINLVFDCYRLIFNFQLSDMVVGHGDVPIKCNLSHIICFDDLST